MLARIVVRLGTELKSRKKHGCPKSEEKVKEGVVQETKDFEYPTSLVHTFVV